MFSITKVYLKKYTTGNGSHSYVTILSVLITCACIFKTTCFCKMEVEGGIGSSEYEENFTFLKHGIIRLYIHILHE